MCQGLRYTQQVLMMFCIYTLWDISETPLEIVLEQTKKSTLEYFQCLENIWREKFCKYMSKGAPGIISSNM